MSLLGWLGELLCFGCSGIRCWVSVEGRWHGLVLRSQISVLWLRPVHHPCVYQWFCVSWLCRFIQASRPDQRMSYRLVTAFPAAQLDDDSASIESAGLANSVIIQKT